MNVLQCLLWACSGYIQFLPRVLHFSAVHSKSSQPFYPTLPSTAMVIKEQCSNSGPKNIVSLVESAAGGIKEASYPGELLRNELQAFKFQTSSAVCRRTS